MPKELVCKKKIKQTSKGEVLYTELIRSNSYELTVVLILVVFKFMSSCMGVVKHEVRNTNAVCRTVHG